MNEIIFLYNPLNKKIINNLKNMMCYIEPENVIVSNNKKINANCLQCCFGKLDDLVSELFK